jgi:hypothetical protein
MTLIVDSFTPNGRASYEINHHRNQKPLIMKSQVSILIYLFHLFYLLHLFY